MVDGLYMRFPYLSCEITWPQGRPRGPSQGQGHMGPWGRTQARAQGRGRGPGTLAAAALGLGPAHGTPCALALDWDPLAAPVAMCCHKKGMEI